MTSYAARVAVLAAELVVAAEAHAELTGQNQPGIARCPKPSCGLSCAVRPLGCWPSGRGMVPHAETRCTGRHIFRGPVESLWPERVGGAS